MKGKILIACLAVCAVFPKPALGNSVELTYPTGTRLATGSLIRAVNVGNLTVTNNKGVSLGGCTAVSMTGPLTKNSGTAVEANIETASFTGGGAEEQCFVSGVSERVTIGSVGGLPWCLRSTESMAEDEIRLRANKCTEAGQPIRLVFDRPSECKYKAAGEMIGTVSTEPSDAIVTFSESLLQLESGMFCLIETKVDLSLTLERDEAGTLPAYFS